MGVYLETPEELSNHRFFLFSNPSFSFLFLVSVCSVAVGKSQQGRSCPGQRGILWEGLLRPLQEGLSCSKMSLEEGRGMKMFWEDE